MTPTPAPPPEPDAAVGYETRDVNLRAVLALAVGVAVMALVVHAALWFLLRSLHAAAGQSDPPRTPLAEDVTIPPGPRLQQAPVRDYQAFRAREEAALDSYGWVDRRQGVVRIPIERAMELLVERGEPTITPPATDVGAPQ